MTQEHDHRYADAAHAEQSSLHDDAIAPGRTSRSALLRRAEQALASGLVPARPPAEPPAAAAAPTEVSEVEQVPQRGSGPPVQAKFSSTGHTRKRGPLEDLATPASGGSALPEELRLRYEARGGVSLAGVRVYHDSPRPAQIGALGYARGLEIHLAPGQEGTLRHELWHTVQHLQGRVAETSNIDGVSLNMDPALESEADDAAGAQDTHDGAALAGMATPALPRSVTAPPPIVQGFMARLPDATLVDEDTGYDYQEVSRSQTGITVQRIGGGPTVVVDPDTMEPIEQEDAAARRLAPASGTARQAAEQRLFRWVTERRTPLAARQAVILAHRANKSLLSHVRSNVFQFRSHNLDRANELLAVVKYLRFVEATDQPQNTLQWIHDMIVRFEGGEVQQWLDAEQRVSDMSVHTSLDLVQRRMSRPENEGAPQTQLVMDYLFGLRREVIGLCTRASFHTAAQAVGMMGEVLKTARTTFGKQWSEHGIIDCADALRRRCAEPAFPWHDADPWSLMKLAGGLAPMARRDAGVDHLLELLTPHINEGLGGGLAMDRNDRYYDRFLVGTIGAYGQLGHRTVETHRTFELAGPPLLTLSRSLGQPLARGAAHDALPIYGRQGRARMTPGNLAEALWAYGHMVGRSDFANLAPEIRDPLLELVATAQRCVPHTSARVDEGTMLFNRDQLIQVTSALLLFRNPPPPLLALLDAARATTEASLRQGRAPVDVLDHLFYAIGFARGDHAALAPSYEAAVTQLAARVDHLEMPGPALVRLMVTAYEGRGALGDLAEWYERQAASDPRTRDASQIGKDPMVQARALRAAQVVASERLEVALGVLLTNLRTALPQYHAINRRRVLHELTRLRSLPAARLPSDLDELERQDEGVPSAEQRLADQVGDVFEEVSGSPELRGDPAALPPLRQAQVLADYAWLGAPRESDRAFINQLIELLTRSCQTTRPPELGRVVMTLGQIHRPDQPVQVFLDRLVVIVASRIARELEALDGRFYADVLGGMRRLPSPVVVRFVQLMEAVIASRLQRPDHQARFANLLRVCGTFVALEDRELSEETDPRAATAELRHGVIHTLRAFLAVNYDSQRSDERGYDREKASSTRQTLPWRGYDRHFHDTYPPSPTLDHDVAEVRRDSEAHFAALGPATGMTSTAENRYDVHTISAEGDLLRTQIMDNIIFRELTRHRFDFVFVELPARAHADRFKGVVAFRGKNFRYDVYGGSKLKAQKKPDRTKETMIHAIGVEEGAIAFFEKMFNFQEGFFYAQRALFPNDDKPTMGLTGGLSVRVYPDELPAFQFGDLPFRTYDGWGFIKASVARRMTQARPKAAPSRPPERGGNMPTQATQWYPEDPKLIAEAVAHGKRAIAGATNAPAPSTAPPAAKPTRGKGKPQRKAGAANQASDEPEHDVDTLYRAMTTGRPPMRNAVAVPVADDHVVLPAGSSLYRGASDGLLIGRTPYDNPNLYPVPGDKVTFREPGDESRDPALAASDFLATMQSIQYTLTGYIRSGASGGAHADDEPDHGLGFFKGMLGIVEDELWPSDLNGVDIALSNSDIKLDESWEGAESKPKIDKQTELVVQGLLVVKEWHTPDSHVGVPTKTQKWLAGDFDGDLDAMMFRAENPELYRTVEDNFREDGVSAKLVKTFTPSDGVRTRSRQIQDVMSPVLGAWSTLADKFNALSPEQRGELATELVRGLVLDTPHDLIASLFEHNPGRLVALNARLNERDAAPLDDAAEIPRWLAIAAPAELALVNEVLAVELIGLEIQLGIKTGTDAYKTKSQAPRYLARSRQYLRTSAALKLGDEPVPYGKGLIRKLHDHGPPDLNTAVWREVYARCVRTYGNPARIMQQMLIELSPPFDASALAAACAELDEAIEAARAESNEGDGEPAVDHTPEMLDELDEIFRSHIYPLIASPGEPLVLPPRAGDDSGRVGPEASVVAADEESRAVDAGIPAPEIADDDAAPDEATDAIEHAAAEPSAPKKPRKKKKSKAAKSASQPEAPVIDRLTPLLTVPARDGSAARALLTRAAAVTGPQDAANALAVAVAKSVCLRLLLARSQSNPRTVNSELAELGSGLAAIDERFPGAAKAGFDALLALAEEKRGTTHGANYVAFLLALHDHMSIDDSELRPILDAFGYRGL